MIRWEEAISKAVTRAELVTLANDFVASWTPRELARLPEACRPSRVRDVEDIRYWASMLAAAARPASGPDACEELRGMLRFFLCAAGRSAEVGDAPVAGDAVAPAGLALAGVPGGGLP